MDELVFIVFMVGIVIVSGGIASSARDKREKEVYIKTEKKKYESAKLDVAQLTKECQYLREQLEKTQKKVATDTRIENSLRNEIKNLKAELLRLVDENFVLDAKVAQFERVALKDFNTISIHLNLLEKNKVEGKDREVVQKALTDLKYKLLRNPQPYISVIERERYEKMLDRINLQKS